MDFNNVTNKEFYIYISLNNYNIGKRYTVEKNLFVYSKDDRLYYLVSIIKKRNVYILSKDDGTNIHTIIKKMTIDDFDYIEKFYLKIHEDEVFKYVYDNPFVYTTNLPDLEKLFKGELIF